MSTDTGLTVPEPREDDAEEMETTDTRETIRVIVLVQKNDDLPEVVSSTTWESDELDEDDIDPEAPANKYRRVERPYIEDVMTTIGDDLEAHADSKYFAA